MSVNTDLCSLNDATVLTLVSGAVTQTQSFHKIAAETSTTDDLDTITPLTKTAAGITYRPFMFLMADTGDTITVKHNTGNFDLVGGANIALSGNDVLLVFYNGSKWSDSKTSASGLSSPVGIADGGTGQTGQTAAFDALAPTTTKGDLIVHNGSDNIRVAVGTNGQVPMAASGATPGLAWGSIGGRLIGTGSVSSDAATIAITGWTDPGFTPAKFVLEVCGLETDRASSDFDNVLAYFNADTTATNYDSNYLYGDGATPSAGEQIGTLAGIAVIESAAAANSDSGFFGILRLEILQPVNTGVYKHCFWQGQTGSGTASEGYASIGGGQWESTAAITAITLTPQVGTTFKVSGAGYPPTLEWRLYAYP
jgi:hypothetical protein